METNEYKSNWKILKYALEFWKILIAVAIVSGILAIVFTSPKFLPPKFTSTAVLYPSNLGEYGSETPLEQMLQYLHSSSIKDSVIKKFNLYDEYDIDQDWNMSGYYMNAEYWSHVAIEKNQNEAVKLTVISQDPQRAKNMVEEIIHQANQKIRRTEREKYAEILEISRNYYNKMKSYKDSMEAELQKISQEYGVFDLPSQSERITEAYLGLLKSGKRGKEFNEVKEMYDNLKEYGRRQQNISIELEEFQELYNDAREEYELALKDYNKIQTYSNLTVEPEVPDRKSYPVRWLIFLLAVFSAVTFTFVLLLIIGYKNR